MSFLDRFKRKEQEGRAPEVKPAPPASAPPASAPPAVAPAPIRRPDMTNQIAAATVAAGYNPDFKLPPKKERATVSDAAPPASDDGEMILELGDFLHRIPQQLLQPGSHDVHMVLKFNLSELADRIARGQTTVPLYEVYKRAPAVFRDPILTSDSAEVRFPWQKVMKLLADAAGAATNPALTSSAAASLSDRLKGRRAVRNIIPGKTEPSAAPAATPPPAAVAPLPAPVLAADPVAEPKIAPAPAPAPAPTPLPTLVTREPEPNVTGGPSLDDEKLTREELVRARDNARLQLARIKGEYERHLSAILQERKSLTEDRDKVFADLAATKKELEDKLEQIAFEKSVASKSSENLRRLQQERDALQGELQAREKEHGQLKADAAKSSAGDADRLSELVAERDALQQQKTHLSNQLAELTKKTPLKLAGAESAAPGTGQSQRQLEELQRRIGVLESGQRESAQELQRERDAKIKLERQLAAADRFKEESAQQTEEALATLRRESETTARKREAEAARLLKETQEQVEAINAAKAKLAGELAAAGRSKEESARQTEEALAALRREFEVTAQQREAEVARQLKEAQEQAEAGRIARTKLEGELEAARAAQATAAASASAVPAEVSWEARAVAQFEADIESYRGRIKSLLQERDALAVDKEKSQAELAAQLQAAADKLAAQTLEKSKISQLETEIAELTKARAELAKTATDYHSQLAAMQEKFTAMSQQRDTAATADEATLAHLRAENEKLAAQLAAAPSSDLVTEKERLARALESARGAHDAALATLREEVKKLSTERDNALKEGENLLGEIDQLKIDREKAQRESSATLQQQLEAQARALQEVSTERQSLAGKHAALLSEHGQLQAKVTGLLADLEAVKQQHGDAAAAIDRDRATREALAAELNTARQAHETALAELRAEHDQTRAAKVELATRHASLAAEHEQVQVKVAGLLSDLTLLRTEHGDASTALERDRAAREVLTADLATARIAHEQLRSTHTSLQGKKTELEGQLAQASEKTRSLETKLEQTEAALREAQASGQASEQTAARLVKEHRTQLDELQAKNERALAALAAEKDAAIASVHAEKTALASATDKKVATLTADHEKALTALAAQKGQELATLQDRLRQEIAILTTERDEKAAHGARAEEKIAALTKQLETAGHEGTALAQQMANAAIQADKKHDGLVAERDRLVAEMAALTANFEEAKETHKAQSAVFAREFKTVISQRDEGLAELEALRKNYEEKSALLATERALRTKQEEELTTRFDRDLARVRRERDTVAQQRDGLRSRIGQLISEQQKMLEDVTTEASHTATKHAEALPAPTPSKRSESKSKSRVEKEANVIDISTAEILPKAREDDNGLKIPRIRPVSVPPPQVRSL